MQTCLQSDRLLFSGTIRELKTFLESLPQNITLREFINKSLH